MISMHPTIMVHTRHKEWVEVQLIYNSYYRKKYYGSPPVYVLTQPSAEDVAKDNRMYRRFCIWVLLRRPYTYIEAWWKWKFDRGTF